MTRHSFFPKSVSMTLAEIATLTGAELVDPACSGRRIDGLAVIDEGGPSHLTFLDNPKYASQLARCHAAACFVTAQLASEVPPHVAVLRVRNPHRAFVAVARELHPDALRPAALFGNSQVDERAVVHPTARLEDGVVIEPLAVIGPHVEIGAGTIVGSGTVIGPHVAIGRSCSIGPNVTIMCSLIGNGVIIHPGCRIGQDGFGFELGAKKHDKVPQLGGVIIQNDVEIGANTTIDRGAVRDTVIGAGTKIDNLVQIGHNVVVGPLCVIVSQVGISGSVTLGEGVVLGARVGIDNHVTIGDRTYIAAMSVVHGNVPAGVRWGGFPARPVKQWFREMLTLERLARNPETRGTKPPAQPSGEAGRE